MQHNNLKKAESVQIRKYACSAHCLASFSQLLGSNLLPYYYFAILSASSPCKHTKRCTATKS